MTPERLEEIEQVGSNVSVECCVEIRRAWARIAELEKQIPPDPKPYGFFVSEDSIRAFIETAAQGCISGRVEEWPQLKPALKWAKDRIRELEERLKISEINAFMVDSLIHEINGVFEKLFGARISPPMFLPEAVAVLARERDEALGRARKAEAEREYHSLLEPCEWKVVADALRKERDDLKIALDVEKYAKEAAVYAAEMRMKERDELREKLDKTEWALGHERDVQRQAIDGLLARESS